MLPKLAACSLLLIGVATATQKKPIPKAQPKPVATKPAPAKPPITVAQAPTDKGQYWIPYALGPKEDQLNLSLESSALALRVPVQDDILVCQASEKLLALTFTVQNPLPKDQVLDQSSFQITCAHPEDDLRTFAGQLYDPTTKSKLITTVKPNSKARFTVYFPVQGVGALGKITVKRGPTPGVSYGITKELKILKGPFATDGGLTAAKEFESKRNVKLPLGKWDVLVEGMSEAREDFDVFEIRENYKWVFITVAITNPSKVEMRLDETVFRPMLGNQAGDLLEYQDELIGVDNGEAIGQMVQPGETVRARFLFTHPVESFGETFTLRDRATGRVLTIHLKK